MNFPDYSVSSAITKDFIEHHVRLSLTEDFAFDDITSESIFSDGNENINVSAHIFVKENSILCGLEFAGMCFHLIDPWLKISKECRDGDQLKKNQIVLSVYGKAKSILKAERSALNFLSFLSGISTKTGEIVRRAKTYQIQILDTRKTIPHHRLLSKYAVLTGGGLNHRWDLSQMGLIKDNHIAFCGSITSAVRKFRTKYPKKKVEVEVDNLTQLKEALQCNADGILLDNMTGNELAESHTMITEFLRQNPDLKNSFFYEASGGFRANNLKKLKGTGIKLVSMGSLTMDIKSTDFSLEISPNEDKWAQ